MEREEVSPPELVIADEARIGCQKPLRGLEGTWPKLRVHGMTVSSTTKQEPTDTSSQ